MTPTSDELDIAEETVLAIAQALIQNAMDQANLSPAQVAAIAGFGPSTVVQLKRNDNLRVRDLARVVSACGFEVKLQIVEKSK
jgi:hypothetical protein